MSEDFYQGIIKRGVSKLPDVDGQDGTGNRQNPIKPGWLGPAYIAGRFSVRTRQELKLIAAKHNTTIQSLLAEGINYVLGKHGRPQIADIPQDNSGVDQDGGS